MKCIGKKLRQESLITNATTVKERSLRGLYVSTTNCVRTCSLFSYYLHIGTPSYFQSIACISRSVHLQLAAAIRDSFSMKGRWIIPILRKTCHRCMCVVQAHNCQWTQNLNQIKIMQHSCLFIYVLRLYIWNFECLTQIINNDDISLFSR